MKSGLSWGRAKLRICPKVTKMGFIIAHRIDYNWVEALRDQRHIPNKINPSTPPPPTPSPPATSTRWA